MTQRILSALVLIALVALPIWQGGLLFLGLVMAAAALALWEFYDLAARSGYRAIRILGLLALVLVVWALPRDDVVLLQAGISLLVVGGLIWELMSSNTDGKLREWALTIVGVLYIGWPASMVVWIRELPDGLWWLLVVLLGTAACDSVAYATGHLFGRHSLAPKYSPKKTWEGTGGGVLACLLVVAISGTTALDLGLWPAALLGILIGPFAIVGDLAESMIKRRIGVKDSSSLIPGHGGLLDRIDSLLFTTTITYFFIQWIAS